MGKTRTAPLLLTPGPVSLSTTVKRSLLADHAFGADSLVSDLRFTRRYLLQLAGGMSTATAVPLAGSGTYASEAVIETFVPDSGKLLVCTNGFYGDTLVSICQATGTPHKVLRTLPTVPFNGTELRQALHADPSITHVIVVHCETSSGILNEIEDISQVCYEQEKVLLIDAVASFGALPLDIGKLKYQALVFSSNKCLEGPPGLAWVIADRSVLDASKGNARSLVLDLWDQNQHIERSGLFRFTPPTHVVSAFAQALREHRDEGGRAARLARYSGNRRELVRKMRLLGFRTLLADEQSAPMLATFVEPRHSAYNFSKLHQGMRKRGFEIFPGPLAVPGTFRIGCIGRVGPGDICDAVDALGEVLSELGVRQRQRDSIEAA